MRGTMTVASKNKPWDMTQVTLSTGMEGNELPYAEGGRGRVMKKQRKP